MIYYGVLLFFVLEYVRPGSFVPGLNLLRLNSVVPVGLIVGTLLTSGPVSNRQILAERNSKIIGWLLGLIVVSLLVTADVTLYAFEIFSTVLGYGLMYWVIARQVTDIGRVRGMFATLVFVHLALAALTPQMFLDPDGRHALSSGTFLGDGNDFALSVNIVVPFCLFLMSEARRVLSKALWAGSLLVLVLCVVATKSRGGTLALAAVGLYYWWKSDKKLMAGLVVAAALAVVVALAPPTYFQRMNTISSYESDGSAQGRLTAWKAAIGMALSNPVLGVGAGQFPPNFVKFAPPGPEGEIFRWTTAHSIYFLILGELGLPGIGLLIGFIVSNLIANRRLLHELRTRGTPSTMGPRLLACLSASLIAFAVAGAFLSAAYYPHMFVIAGLSVAVRRIVRDLGDIDTLATTVPVPLDVQCHPATRRLLLGGRV